MGGGYQIGLIEKNAPYRVSLQAAIWKREYVLSIIDEKDSAWQFEYFGSKRSALDDSRIASVWDKKPKLMLDYYVTGVIQGYWIKEAVKLCEENGVSVDLTNIRLEPSHIRYKRLITTRFLTPVRDILKKTPLYDRYRKKKYS